jgi:hypothetical protein
VTGTVPPDTGDHPGPVHPDGPGRIAAGQRVTCLPGSLPAREGGRGGGVLVSIGPKTSAVQVYGGRRRRIANELLHPQAGPRLAADRDARGLRTATADGRDWLPGWSWLDWTIADHVQYQQGTRHLPTPPPAPQRLIIIACGARKAECVEAPAGDMYVGSYHRAARRAADAISTPGDRVMILSARYGLLDPADRILRYEMRLGSRGAIIAQSLREQAEQLGVLDTVQVVVLAPAAYGTLAAQVWPHAQLALAGTRGIGDQMARFAALATGRATIADLVTCEPGVAVSQAVPAATAVQHAVSVRGGLVHLGATVADPAGALAPACRAHQRGRSWRPTDAEITCTRCAAVVLRRRALHRWCTMVDRIALAADVTPVGTSSGAPAPAGSRRPERTGPAPRRPATHSARPGSRCPADRRAGGSPRRRHPGRWRHVPAPPYRATPLTWTADSVAGHRPRHAHPRGPRSSIGRAPPPGRVGWRRCQASTRRLHGDRPDRMPLTPVTSLSRENAATRSGSANGSRQPSNRTTRRAAARPTLAEPQRPAAAPQRTQASANGPTQTAPDQCWRTARGLDRTPEVRPMTDLTTRPVQAGTPDPALAPVPVNGAAAGDIRALRRASRAEQDRLSADAEVERRARAARLELELREQRRAAARRERQANEQDKQARTDQRRARRGARQAQLRAAAPRWADRALFILPILFPMAVAWVGQIRFAMTVMSWPLPAAIVFAAGFELSTAYVARLDWRSRAAGDSALLFRGATWGFAAGAAIMNYWHAAGPNFAPTGEAVSYGLMSITGVVLWELLSTYRHRTALRAEGKLPAARPRYGLARWIWFRPLTRLAWLLALRDGYTTTDLAWRAALTAVERYGSARGARKAVRAGRPVSQPEPLDTDEHDNRRDDEDARGRDITPQDEQLRDVDGHHADREVTERYLERDSLARDNVRDAHARHEDRDVTERYLERDTAPPLEQRDTAAGVAEPTGDATGERHHDHPGESVQPAAGDEPPTGRRDDLPDGPGDHEDATLDRNEDQGRHNDAATDDQEPGVSDEPADREENDASKRAGDGDRPVEPDSTSKGALIARMKTYARERATHGVSVTGADLDRQFGTRDYGRKVLRQLAAEPQPGGPGQP